MMSTPGSARRALAAACAVGGAAACATNATSSDAPYSTPASLQVQADASPDTVSLGGELTLSLTVKNPLPTSVLAPGPCVTEPLRLQVVGADSVVRVALVGRAGGCKLPNGPATVRLSPGWSESLVSRGLAANLLPPGTVAGRYRLRGVYEAPRDTARGEWFSLWVLP